MLVRFDLGDGEFVVAELERADSGVVEAASASDVVARATGSFAAALEQVRAAAALTVRRMRDLPQRPDEVTVEFGVQLDAEVGAVLARTGAQGHLQVQLTWRRGEEPATAPPPAAPPAPAPARTAGADDAEGTDGTDGFR
ncbi:CU044_2847 family protein [Streptomyces anandii]|uniref:CU044_2847 family protein n=1 Tax=Streptomyces anandii TaxID=285454 RepID=UPI0036FA419D